MTGQFSGKVGSNLYHNTLLLKKGEGERGKEERRKRGKEKGKVGSLFIFSFYC